MIDKNEGDTPLIFEPSTSLVSPFDTDGRVGAESLIVDPRGVDVAKLAGEMGVQKRREGFGGLLAG